MFCFKDFVNEKLIKAFLDHPVLWDPSNPKFNSKTFRRSALKDLSLVMGLGVGDLYNDDRIKLFIEYIKKTRGQLKKEAKKRVKTTGSEKADDVAKAKWWEDFKLMGLDLVKPTTKDSNTDPSKNGVSFQPQAEKIVTGQEIKICPCPPVPLSSPVLHSKLPSCSNNNNSQDPSSDMSKSTSKCKFETKSETKSDSKSESKSDSKSNSKHYHFVMFVAQELDGMSPDKARQARRAIQRALLDCGD